MQVEKQQQQQQVLWHSTSVDEEHLLKRRFQILQRSVDEA